MLATIGKEGLVELDGFEKDREDNKIPVAASVEELSIYVKFLA